MKNITLPLIPTIMALEVHLLGKVWMRTKPQWNRCDILNDEIRSAITGNKINYLPISFMICKHIDNIDGKIGKRSLPSKEEVANDK